MRRRKASKGSRAIPILVAVGIGYLIGAWSATAVRSKEPSGAPTAAQTVALRFPQAMSEVPVVQAAAYQRPATAAATGGAELALFAPEPIAALPAGAPQAVAQPTAPHAAGEPAPWQTADISPEPPAPRAAEAAAPIAPKPRELSAAAKPHPALARRRAEHSGYMLDNAQIADIKRRLHLTPDQERMWPAVEAALRTIGSEKEREVRSGSAPATINPDSPEVQDLKSAAIPLLMSFSDEQKDEVRNLARGMGLNQLASEF